MNFTVPQVMQIVILMIWGKSQYYHIMSGEKILRLQCKVNFNSLKLYICLYMVVDCLSSFAYVFPDSFITNKTVNL